MGSSPDTILFAQDFFLAGGLLRDLLALLLAEALLRERLVPALLRGGLLTLPLELFILPLALLQER